MAERTCTIEDCESPHLARGLCNLHYYRATKSRRSQIGPCPTCGGDGPPFRDDPRCKTCRRATATTWSQRNPAAAREVNSRHAAKAHRRRRALVLAHYGGSCACCGEAEVAFLAIDHIDGGGNAHRRSLSKSGKMVGSSNFYAWLVRNGYPPGFRVLCHNCNFANSHGGCPHGNC